MRDEPRKSVPTWTTFLIVIALVVLGIGGLEAGYFTGNSVRQAITTTSTVLQSTTATLAAPPDQTTSTDPCFIAGQPAGMFLRVVSDNGDAPIAGAKVTANHSQANDYCNGVLYTGAAATTSFTTDGTTTWYPLDTTNDGSYSLIVQYSGHAYNFTAGMEPIAVTCATLYVPSGRTNVTFTFTSPSNNCR